MEIIEVEQGTPEWRQVRCGIVTASRVSNILAKGEGKTRRRYMYHLLAERITGKPIDAKFMSSAMQRGNEFEEQARANYELEKCVDVKQVGFVKMSNFVGASPDGLIGRSGGLEIKCPDTHTHIENLLKRELPSKYKAQVQGSICICERNWWDFVSYDDRVVSKEMMIVRVNRDDQYIRILENEIDKFVEEMLSLEHQLKGDIEKLFKQSILKEQKREPLDD